MWGWQGSEAEFEASAAWLAEQNGPPRQEEMESPPPPAAGGGGGGGDQGEGPSRPARLEEGMTVEANYKGKGKWLKGKIKRENADGTLDIEYDAGGSETQVEKGNVRHPPHLRMCPSWPECDCQCGGAAPCFPAWGANGRVDNRRRRAMRKLLAARGERVPEEHRRRTSGAAAGVKRSRREDTQRKVQARNATLVHNDKKHKAEISRLRAALVGGRGSGVRGKGQKGRGKSQAHRNPSWVRPGFDGGGGGGGGGWEGAVARGGPKPPRPPAVAAPPAAGWRYVPAPCAECLHAGCA
jgi:hypothetical protein